MFAEIVKNRKHPAGVLASATAHAALLGLIVIALHFGRSHPVYTESRCCSTALYWSANTGAGSPKPKIAAHAKRPAPAPKPSPEPTVAAAAPVPAQTAPSQVGATTSSQQQPTLGTGNGSDNAEPALPLFFPHPGVADRSLLPIAKQNVIVEVDISALGDVTDEKLVSGLGNSLDQIVLETVKSWRFRPATLNGSAIASVEDLVFPFDKDYDPNAAS
jgi:protein TonB